MSTGRPIFELVSFLKCFSRAVMKITPEEFKQRRAVLATGVAERGLSGCVLFDVHPVLHGLRVDANGAARRTGRIGRRTCRPPRASTRARVRRGVCGRAG